MPAPVLIVCPTRNRPDSLKRAVQAWRDTTWGCSDFCAAIDDDQPGYGPFIKGVHYDMRPRKRMVQRFNEATMARIDKYEAIVFIGDDHVFKTPGWDQKMLARLREQKGWGILYGDDKLKGEELATAAMLSSNLIKTLGAVCPQTLQHMSMDSVWMTLGRETGILTYMPEIVIEHLHFSVGKSTKDEGYNSLYPVVAKDHEEYRAWEADGRKDADVAKIKAAMGAA